MAECLIRSLLLLARNPVILSLSLTGFFLAGELNATGARHTLVTHPNSGISITVQPFFSEIPPRGYFPARVSISNHSGRAQQWELSTTNHDWGYRTGQTRARFSFNVPQGESSVFDILVPVGAAAGNPAQGGRTMFQFSGFGVQPYQDTVNISQHFIYRGGGRAANSVFVGMTQSLHSVNWGRLEQDPRANISGASINPDRLPGDWRGLSGFNSFWLTDTEWRRIGGIERQAILDWAAGGGWLFVCRDVSEEGAYPRLAGLPASEQNEATIPYGFGMVNYFRREGNQLDIDDAAMAIGLTVPAGTLRLERRIHETDWDLFRAVSLPQIPVFFFSAFLTVFAILVGPVNFLFFARPGQRHRLLWTTPLISLGVGSLLFLLILFHDGTGGTGMRLAVWHHLPEENKAVVLQEQVARTGLVVSSGFSPQEPALLTQLNIYNGRSESGQRFGISGNRYDGDWFLSRSAQAQLIHSVPSTRSRIEFHNTGTAVNSGAPPEIVSTMPHPLETLYYRDGEGVLWSGGPLFPGAPLALERANEIAFENWWRDNVRRASPVSRDIIDAHKSRNGYFFASASGEAATALDTLQSIDWSEQYSIHLGPLSSAR